MWTNLDSEGELIWEAYQSSSGLHLNPAVLYNFYFLYTLSQTVDLEDADKFLVDAVIKDIKKIYLDKFKKVLYKQIEKYVGRGRVDKDFGGFKPINEYSVLDLNSLIQKTFRSDMTRRNNRWNMLGEYLVKLDRAEDFENISFFIDRINNVVHNTGDIMLDKFDNGPELMSIFDKVHNFQSIREFGPYINSKLRKLIRKAI